MRIQVNCRDGADPSSFWLGEKKLHVLRVLERTAEDDQRRLRVRVADGREFVLRQHLESGEWTLAGVAPRAA
ncbi:MAG TPA: hypothetical protein VFZ84_09795 [Burkholderiales bacterium]